MRKLLEGLRKFRRAEPFSSLLIVRGGGAAVITINIDCKKEEILLIQIDDLQELKDSDPTAAVRVTQDI